MLYFGDKLVKLIYNVLLDKDQSVPEHKIKLNSLLLSYLLLINNFYNMDLLVHIYCLLIAKQWLYVSYLLINNEKDVKSKFGKNI